MKKSVLLFGFLIAFCFQGYNQTYYYQSGDTVAKNGQTYTSSIQDTSGVRVTNRGVFILGHSSVRTSGNSSSTDNSSRYGLNAGVLSKQGSWIRFNSDTVVTTGSGANGLFATDSASRIDMTLGSITTGNNLAHGVAVSYGGSVAISDVNITTNGTNSSAIANDFSGGTVNVMGGTLVAAATAPGSHSPGIYSTGTVMVYNAAVTSAGDNGAVIDGSGSIDLALSNLTGALNGVMITNTATGSSVGSFSMNGGSLTAHGGDAFFTSGASGTVSVSGGISISASSGNLVNTVSSGQTNFSAGRVQLTGNFVCDNTSLFSVLLSDTAVLTGSINAGNTAKQVTLTMDAGSLWNLTAISYVPIFIDHAGIDGDSIVNINGNGFDVVYDETNKKNSYLNAYKYKLRKGGWLTCPTCTLGVDEPAANAATLTCSPNPAASGLNILVNDPLPRTVTVYNTLGVKISDLEISRNATIDVSRWANGLYFFRMNNTTVRVIVMH